MLKARSAMIPRVRTAVASNRLIRRRASFKGDAIVSLAGSGLARAITLASMPLVTRLYAPADLGVWAIILNLANILIPFATLQFDIAVVIAPTRRSAVALLLIVAACTLTVAAASSLAIAYAPRKALEAISGLGPEQQGLLALVPLVLVLLAAQTGLQAWLTRQREFGVLSLAQLLQAAAAAVAMLILPLIAGASALVAATAAIFGLVIWQALPAWNIGVDIVSAFAPRLLAAARASLRRFKVYPLYFLPYSLSAGLAERVLQLVLASAYSLSALGTFYVARQLMLGPVGLLVGTLRQVVFAHSARQKDAAEIKARVGQILRLLIDVLAPALAFSFVWMMPALATVMGAKWAPQLGAFAWWTLFPAAALLLTGWLDRMLDVLGRQRLAVVLQLASDAVVIVVALVSPLLGLDEIGMVATLSTVTAIIHVFWLGLILKLMGFELMEFLAPATRALALGLLLGTMHFAIAKFLAGPWGLVEGIALLCVSLSLPGYKLARRFKWL